MVDLTISIQSKKVKNSTKIHPNSLSPSFCFTFFSVILFVQRHFIHIFLEMRYISLYFAQFSSQFFFLIFWFIILNDSDKKWSHKFILIFL